MRYIKKPKWGSIKITSCGSVIAYLSSCIYFENIDRFADAVKRKQIYAKHWIISIPDNLCITKIIELPASDIDQAYKMLEFELSSYLPLPIEELVYGCMPISRNENLLKVLVYILKVKALEDILAKLKSIGIKPSRVMVDSVAAKSWFSNDEKNDSAQINLLFNNKNTIVFAIKDGIVQRQDDISLENTDLENQREYIIEQINNTATELATDKQITLKIAASQNIGEKIKSWFNGNFNNIEPLELPQLNSFDKESNSFNGKFIFESVVAQGLVKSVENPELKYLNLLGQKVIKKAHQKQFIKNSVATFVLAIFTIFSLWLNFVVMNWRIDYVCHKLAKEIAPIKHIAIDVESKHQKLKAIEAQLSNRKQISEIFSQLYKYSPKNISISQMSYSSKADAASVNIKGQADTLSSAFEYSNAMKNSELLNSIQIINAQQIPKPGGSIVEFKAECTMKGNSK